MSNITNGLYQLVFEYAGDSSEQGWMPFCCGRENCNGCNVRLIVLVSYNKKLLYKVRESFNRIHEEEDENYYLEPNLDPNSKDEDDEDDDDYSSYDSTNNLYGLYRGEDFNFDTVFNKINEETGIDLSCFGIEKYKCCGKTEIIAQVEPVTFRQV